jgi:pimeloyl-ACP methyl ester carboxylesterase
MPEKNRFPIWARILVSIVGLFAALGIGFALWGLTPARPMPEAITALQSDAQVKVTTGNWLVFQPATGQPDTGFIFYPGGHVDYRAYAPAARSIAEQGFLVVIVRMPLSLAVLDAGAASSVIAAYPQIKHWAVGGHSLGGAMAANFVYTHPGSVEGLVLWAAYPAGNNDLSNDKIKTISISGSLDGLSTPEKIAGSKHLLPPDTAWLAIQGGDHAQFGWYGPQSGDNAAAITRADQQDQVVQATLEFLAGLR